MPESYVGPNESAELRLSLSESDMALQRVLKVVVSRHEVRDRTGRRVA